MIILIIFVAIIVIAAAMSISQAKARAERAQAVTARISEKYKPEIFYVSQVDGSFLGLSFDQGQIFLGDADFDKAYMFSEIVEIECVRDGASVTKTNRGSQLLGAAVGGVALGGVGLLLGGLTGSKRTTDKVVSLAIRITVDDRVRPLQTVKFFQWADRKGLEPSSPLVKPTVEQMETFNAHLLNAMRRAQQQQQEVAAAPVTVQLPSQADEIKKLWDLRTLGALTAEEFEERKQALLS